MNHSGQETMSQPPKNQEMLKLYTFNLRLTNPEEQCPSTTQTIIPTAPPDGHKTRAAPEQSLWPLQIIYTCKPCPAQVISPSSKKPPDAASAGAHTDSLRKVARLQPAWEKLFVHSRHGWSSQDAHVTACDLLSSWMGTGQDSRGGVGTGSQGVGAKHRAEGGKGEQLSADQA